MSKNNKYKHAPQNNLMDTNLVIDEPEQVEAVIEGEVDETPSNIVLTEEDIIETPVDNNIVEDIDKTNESPVILETKVEEESKKVTEPIKEPSPIKFYKVGTDHVNGKCINQVTTTTSLSIAKSECNAARNKLKKTYHVFNPEGDVIYTSEYTTPKDNYYRVGTEWKNGVCINQKISTMDLNSACGCADDNTKITGTIHHVFDPSGKIVFSSKKKLTLFSYKKREVNKNVDWYTK